MNYEKIGIVIRNGVATYLASEMIADKNKALTMTDKQREVIATKERIKVKKEKQVNKEISNG